MGQDSSKHHQIACMEKYTEILKEQHLFLGNITHLIHRSFNTKHLLKILKFTTENELSLAVKKIHKRKHLSLKKGSNNIIRATQAQTNKNNQLCGITYYLYAIYEDYSNSLASLIQEHQNCKQYFLQQEIMEMLRGVCQGLLFLQDNGYKNYTITKQSIVKECRDQNKSYVYKIIDQQLSKQILPYTKLLNNIPIEKGTYLSPETLLQLYNKNTDPDLSLKSDIFSLAMVTLEMCLLQPLDSVYNYGKYQLNQYAIIEKLNSLKCYSSYLKSILSQMLEHNEQQRIGAVSLRQKLHLGNLCNDGKSTTDYGYSAIQNSNITQKTYKTSYPNNVTTKQPINSNENGVKGNGHLKMERILTLKHMKNQQKYQLLQNKEKTNQKNRTDIQQITEITNNKNMNINMGIDRRNKSGQPKINKIINVGYSKNKSRQQHNKNNVNINININSNSKIKNQNNQISFDSSSTNTIANHFQPNIIKPMTVPILSKNINNMHFNDFHHNDSNQINKKYQHQQNKDYQIHNNDIHPNLFTKSNNDNGYKINLEKLPGQTLPTALAFSNLPIQQFLPSHTATINNSTVNDNQQIKKKLPQIIIPDSIASPEKAEPQTPINNLKDSISILGHQQISSYKIKNSKIFEDDVQSIQILTSFNNGNTNLKMLQLNNEQNSSLFYLDNIEIINQSNIEYQSPQKQLIPSSIFCSNESTPIRKVQALQSLDNINNALINQIIKQTDEQSQKEMNSSEVRNEKINMKKKGINSQQNYNPSNRSKTYCKQQLASGRIYQGQMDSFGNFCGNGTLYFSNGNVCYTGGWNKGLFHGFGLLHNQISDICYIPTNYQNFNLNSQNSWHRYEGQFNMGKKHGLGTLHMANGDKFSGCFVNDIIDGYGTFTNIKGEKILGIWNQNILYKFE